MIPSMWEQQDRSLEMSTPRYLAEVTVFRIWPWKQWFALAGFLDLAPSYKTFFKLNSAEHEISTAYQY